MSYDENNVFAQILRGELPAHIVAEDDLSVAFMDAMPQSPGHTLVIPKEQAEDIFSISQVVLQHVILQTQRVASAVDQAFNPAGVMIVQLNRVGAGQSVFHLHFHIIPRWKGLDMKFHARTFEDSNVLAEHAKRIREALNNLGN